MQFNAHADSIFRLPIYTLLRDFRKPLALIDSPRRRPSPQSHSKRDGDYRGLVAPRTRFGVEMKEILALESLAQPTLCSEMRCSPRFEAIFGTNSFAFHPADRAIDAGSNGKRLVHDFRVGSHSRHELISGNQTERERAEAQTSAGEESSTNFLIRRGWKFRWTRRGSRCTMESCEMRTS